MGGILGALLLVQDAQPGSPECFPRSRGPVMAKPLTSTLLWSAGSTLVSGGPVMAVMSTLLRRAGSTLVSCKTASPLELPSIPPPSPMSSPRWRPVRWRPVRACMAAGKGCSQDCQQYRAGAEELQAAQRTQGVPPGKGIANPNANAEDLQAGHEPGSKQDQLLGWGQRCRLRGL